ncbi:recombinase family protein [Streptomyces sp. NPDC092296]|uniref:recombinase family protein n=1 Tax=Streptomyces sp. NPDC092296 TaxID=3366012 RepID=UPI0037F8B040
MPAEHGGKGWTLVPDPEAVAVITRIVKELLEGVSVSLISAGLHRDGIPTPRDHWALKQKRKTGGKTGGAKGEKGTVRERFAWNPAVITRMLRNPTLLGWKMHKGKPIRDDQGDPITSPSPILRGREGKLAPQLPPFARGRPSGVVARHPGGRASWPWLMGKPHHAHEPATDAHAPHSPRTARPHEDGQCGGFSRVSSNYASGRRT